MKDLSGAERLAGLEHWMKDRFHTLIAAPRSTIDCFGFKVLCLSVFVFMLVIVTIVAIFTSFL